MEKTVFEQLSEATDNFVLYSRERFLFPVGDMLTKQGVVMYSLSVLHHRVLNPLDTLFRGKWVSMKELAVYAKSDRGNLSRAIYELVEMGLIEIRNDTKDRRMKYVRMTEKGEQLGQEGNRAAITLSEAYFRKYMTDYEIEDMYNCLAKVNAYWQKLQPKEFFGEE